MIIRLNAILDAMAANKTTFPSPPVAIALAQAHVAALSSAESALKSKTPGAKPVRDAALKLAIEDAHQLHTYVAQLCNASPDQASAIAADAAMALRKAGVHPSTTSRSNRRSRGRCTSSRQRHRGRPRATGGSTRSTGANRGWQHAHDAGPHRNHGVFDRGGGAGWRHRSIGKAGPRRLDCAGDVRGDLM